MTFSCCCCYCKPSNLETKSLDNTFRSRTRPGSINPGADDDKRDTHTSEVSSSKNLIYHQIKHQITLLTNCYACHNSHVSSQLQCCVYCLALLLLLAGQLQGKKCLVRTLSTDQVKRVLRFYVRHDEEESGSGTPTLAQSLILINEALWLVKHCLVIVMSVLYDRWHHHHHHHPSNLVDFPLLFPIFPLPGWKRMLNDAFHYASIVLANKLSDFPTTTTAKKSGWT